MLTRVIWILILTCGVSRHIVGSRPHIILMVADDLGWDDVGFHGSEIKTPYIDSLAYEGVILNNYYVSPICTPTRGSLMTGRHPIHLGLQHSVILGPQPWGLPLDHKIMAQHMKVLGYSTHIVGKIPVIGSPKYSSLQHYVIAAAEPWGLPLNFTTMGQHFKRLGYATHIVGKWHLGFFRSEYLPTNRGFDSHYGYWTGKEDYFNHLDFDWHLGFFRHEYLPINRGFDTHFGYWTEKEDYYKHTNNNEFNGLDFRRGMTVINETFYSTEKYTEEATKLIEAHNTSEPLFLYMAYQAVHAGNANDPIQAPDAYINRFPYITNERRRKFAGVTAALDDSVGSVVRALRKRGMLDNSIVVFTTDNGGPANNYDLNAACNYPLRGTKNTMWEGGVHGVGFVHSNLLEKHRYMSNNLIHVSDWLPTLYSAAGGDIADLGNIDGIDMWNMLKTNGTQVRNELLHNIDPRSHFSAIRVGDYKLVQGDVSGGRNDMWYTCNPPKVDNISMTYDLDYMQYSKLDTNGLKRKKRESPHTPVNIDCGEPPVNYTKNCEPKLAPCLFHIPSDPCEYNNIADQRPEIVQVLLRRIDEYASSAVEPVNKPADKQANPALHGGVWVPWQDPSLL